MVSESGKADNEYRVEDDNSIPQQRQQQQQQRANEGEDQDQPQDQNDSESCMRMLRLLTPEEYLQQTGASRAIEEALGLVASLRPQNPLDLFAAIMRDKAKNTHPAVRQAKLLRHARRSTADAHLCYKLDPHGYKLDAGRRMMERDTKSTTPIQHQKAAAESIVNSASTQNKQGWKGCQLEILCEPLYHFLCGSSSCERFTGRYGGGSGARGGGTRGRKTTRDRKGNFRLDGCRASWREVRRFLEALCRGAGVDAECTSVAMVALEREGFSTDSRGTSAGHNWTPEIGVDFNSFVAAVRVVLLFEGFERGARKALLELTGTVDDPAPLDKLLERLFPINNSSINVERAENGGVGDIIRERLHLRLREETKVRLSTITDCVFRSPTSRKTHDEKLS
ncbi:unnamed protein product [Ascophyllum nodosum]